MSETHPAPTTEHHLDRQPSHEQAAATAQAAPTSVEPVTPQDPHAAGAATEEQHALLQKNVSGSHQKGAAEQAKDLEDAAGGTTAGYHSTGSSTGTTGGQ
jgi:hypothetical protein